MWVRLPPCPLSMNNKQRLLDIISPVSYDITLRPDMRQFTFTGEETVIFFVKKPTNDIVLHAKNLIITQAVLLLDGKEHEAEIVYNKKDMTVVFHFAEKLAKGEQKIHITFSGIIGEQLKGWYKSAYAVNGEKRHMATTQFEEIGARQVFPSIDDPSAKAVFHISLVVPKALTAIANTIDTHVVEHEDGYKTVTFAPTPKMATYALAFIVGEFDFLEGMTSSGVRVRVFVTPGKKSQAQFALDTAIKMLPFYEKYFDIAYPLPVLDFIAIPDFDAGAMENWGAITAREAALLIDDLQSTASNKQLVAVVIAHELTHMWFGNLVTMKWWDDLWLNEGFASYMEYVGVHAIFPDWNMWEQFAVLDHNRAMGLDSLENTHPIQVKITDVEKIGEIFDEVSYSKGASVIQMLAVYLGEKDFRDGLRLYLKTYSYSNAETNNLWEALEKVSKKPVKKIMDAFTQKPGHPLLTAKKHGDMLTLSQTRFYSSMSSRKTSKDTTVWVVPLTNVWDEKEATLLFEEKEKSYPFHGNWVKINRNETSFARVIYDEALYENLKNPIEQKLLGSIDRMGVLRDAFDSAESGYQSVAHALNLAQSYVNESSYTVWANLVGKIGKVENLIQDEKVREAYYAYARSLFEKIGKKVGWEKKTTDSHEDILLRSLILGARVTYKDKQTIAKAQELFAEVIKNKENVDTNIRGVLYAAVAENGGIKEFEILRDMYIAEELSAEKNRIGGAMCLFEDPSIVKKTLDFSLSDHVRTQDIGRFLVFSFGNRKGREVTWEFVTTHWDELLEKMEGLSLDWIIEGAASVVSEKLFSDIKTFFASHPHPKLEKRMKQVVEQIESNIAWKNRDRESIEKFLQSKV